jgi:hypothetical protein
MGRRRYGPWLLAGSLAAGVGASLILLVYPTLPTGGFYEITIDSISFDPRGNVTLEYHDRLAFGTAMFWIFPAESGTTGPVMDDWRRRTPGFLRWPRTNPGATLGFWLTSREERERGITDSADLHRRLLLEAGKTYRIRIGERIVYYRRAETNGKVMEAFLQAEAQP